MGNLRSVQKSFEAVGADAIVTSDSQKILSAQSVVLPGVGAFKACMDNLEKFGLIDTVKKSVQSGKPFLGICVGMQLLYKGSDESVGVNGLGVINEQVKALEGDVKIPQMQWNELKCDFTHQMLDGIEKNPWVYFVHSYSAPKTKESIAFCNYGTEVNAAIAVNNLWATQFHTEKSGETGIAILRNFLSLLENAGS